MGRFAVGWRGALAIILMLAGLHGLLGGLGLKAKAWLAQVLIERAWSQTLVHGVRVPPWPWADTTPVARLEFVRQGQASMVLAGDSGRTLAFGPGHRSHSAPPGGAGNSVISGHRDTHFQVLREVRIGDELRVQSRDGRRHRYRVEQMLVVDKSRVDLADDHGRDELTLVTCWPFDTLNAGGPLRYVVRASAVVSASAIPDSTLPLPSDGPT